MKIDNDFLRAYLAALAFRFSHLAKDIPNNFADFEAGQGVKTPIEILRHMTQLVNFIHLQFEELAEQEQKELDWQDEAARFLQKLKDFDQALANGAKFSDKLMPEENLWQGPLADTMTHIGQLAMLRRLAGKAVEKVSYWQADIYKFK